MFDKMKKLFLVKTPAGGTRLSKDMVGNTVVLASSLLVAVGGIGHAIAGAEAAAITGGIMAISNIILRLTSDGGKLEIKDKPPADDVDDDEWFRGGMA